MEESWEVKEVTFKEATSFLMIVQRLVGSGISDKMQDLHPERCPQDGAPFIMNSFRGQELLCLERRRFHSHLWVQQLQL